jgi:hypothetical protein
MAKIYVDAVSKSHGRVDMPTLGFAQSVNVNQRARKWAFIGPSFHVCWMEFLAIIRKETELIINNAHKRVIAFVSGQLFWIVLDILSALGFRRN